MEFKVPSHISLEWQHWHANKTHLKKLYSQVYVPPSSLGKKNSIRQNLRQAGKLLKEAGWRVQKNLDGS